MTRSGYSDDCENLSLYRANVYRAINGSRGQSFLCEMAVVLDSMEKKELLPDVLVSDSGVCAIGSVLQKRGIDTGNIDVHDPAAVAKHCGIASCLAAEIEYINDEVLYDVSPAERWQKMRRWIQKCIDGKVTDDFGWQLSESYR